MYKIQVYEHDTDHNGNAFTGYVNFDGRDISFENRGAALMFALEHAEFFEEFSHYAVVDASQQDEEKHGLYRTEG